MFEKKGNRCLNCEYIDVDVKAKIQSDRFPCINCSRLYYDYYKISEERNLPKNKIKCIKCGKIVDTSRGLRSSTNNKLGICNSCFNKTV